MARATVLIIDDDPDQHAVCGVYLQHAGYAVLHAFDGREGVRVAREHLPDLVMMDIRMPRLDGIAARRLLADDPATAHIPVLAVSADVMTWPERRVLQEGFAGHVPKPSDLRRMGALVERLAPCEPAKGRVAGAGPAVAA